MSEEQKRRRGQVDAMTGAIVMHSRWLEGWTSEERQFVIQETRLALDCFRQAVDNREGDERRKKRVKALKYLIRMSQDGDELMKQIMFILIDASELLTKGVYITLHPGAEFDGETINGHAHAAGEFTSSNRSMHLDQIMIAMGTDFRFSLHYGHYENGMYSTAGQAPGFGHGPKGMPIRYTFWLAPGNYGHGPVPPEEVCVTRAQIEAVDITQDGLYSF